ncbi:MAG: AIR synthase related protein [Candidatus Sigynarchaeota archaeon]
MDFDAFVAAIRNHAAIKKKLVIHDVLTILADNKFNNTCIFKGIGEDAAAVEIEGDTLMLVATDMISSDFVKRAPFSAGYSAILVCVDDIFACGGVPLTAAIDVQAATEAVLHELVRGAKKAAEQLGISITRGHTSLKEGGDAMSCTVVGEHASKADFVSAGDARPGQVLVLVWDYNGKRSPNGPYWDTVTFKTSEEVRKHRALMVELAGSPLYGMATEHLRTSPRERLIHASKDVSDAGLFGTAMLFANYSRVGFEIEERLLFETFNVDNYEDLLWFTTAYLTTGFLVTIDERDIYKVQRKAIGSGMQAAVIGRVIPGSNIHVVHEGKSRLLLDWRETPIFPDELFKNPHDGI